MRCTGRSVGRRAGIAAAVAGLAAISLVGVLAYRPIPPEVDLDRGYIFASGGPADDVRLHNLKRFLPPLRWLSANRDRDGTVAIIFTGEHDESNVIKLYLDGRDGRQYRTLRQTGDYGHLDTSLPVDDPGAKAYVYWLMRSVAADDPEVQEVLDECWPRLGTKVRRAAMHALSVE